MAQLCIQIRVIYTGVKKTPILKRPQVVITPSHMAPIATYEIKHLEKLESEGCARIPILAQEHKGASFRLCS